VPVYGPAHGYSADRVMHATLRFGTAGVIMLSDSQPGMPTMPTT
jgi:hypothetical protein